MQRCLICFYLDYNHLNRSGALSAVGTYLSASSPRRPRHLVSIQSFTFMPDPSGYYCVHHDRNADDRAVWSRVPLSLRLRLEDVTDRHRRTQSGDLINHPPRLRCSVGKDGAWVLIHLSTGRVDVADLPPVFTQKLRLIPTGKIKVTSEFLTL